MDSSTQAAEKNLQRNCATYRREKRLKQNLKDVWRQRKLSYKLMAKEENLQKALKNEDKSTIQYHFLDGSACQRRYFCDATLRHCINDLVRSHPKRLPQAFKLRAVRPNCEFDSDDEDLTLIELGLVPLADLYVVSKLTPVLTGGQRGVIGKLLAFFLYVISFPMKLALNTEHLIADARASQIRRSRDKSHTDFTNDDVISKKKNMLPSRKSNYFPASLSANGLEDSYNDSSSSAAGYSV